MQHPIHLNSSLAVQSKSIRTLHTPSYNNQPSQCNTNLYHQLYCVNRPFPSSTCFLDTHTHNHVQNYFWRISFQSSSVSIETFNEGEANKTAAFLSTTAPRNNRYHYHSARRRTIWTGSHGQLQGRAWYRQLKFMRKSLTFVHGRRIEGDVTTTARFIISGEEGTRSSYF